MTTLNDDDPAGWPTFVFHKTVETQECPSCGTVGPFSPRHSPYICLKCSRDVANESGDRMVFADVASCRPLKDDPGVRENWRHHSIKDPFYLGDIPVMVYEGRFGGWVVKYRDDANT